MCYDCLRVEYASASSTSGFLACTSRKVALLGRRKPASHKSTGFFTFTMAARDGMLGSFD